MTQLSQPLTQTASQRSPTLRPAKLQGNRLDLRGELFEIVRFGDVGGDAQALELLTLGRADTAGPEQQQVGLEAEQPLHVQLAVAANGGQILEFGGTLAGIQHANQQVGRTQLNDNFRERRRQADNPFDRDCRATGGQQQHRQPDRTHQPS
ncbi:hypothetical protein D3C76_1255280 [compost metagenome]